MDIVKRIKEQKVIAIVRGLPSEEILEVAGALVKGGIGLLEVTFNQAGDPLNTTRSIKAVSEKFGDELVVGAGTVMSKEQVDLAYEAGAKFILAPNIDEEVIRYAKTKGLVTIPGAFTPSEIAAGYKAGADVIKLFPAGNLGTSYIKAIMAPINHIPIIAVGGVDHNNIADFLKVGVIGAGIGSNIVKNELVAAKDYEGITELAKKYVEAVK